MVLNFRGIRKSRKNRQETYIYLFICQNSKPRLAKKNLPHLKLVATYTPANLLENVKTCLKKLSVRNSTTFLHWLKDNGELKTFVRNRVSKIQEKGFIKEKYVPRKKIQLILGVQIVKYVNSIVSKFYFAKTSRIQGQC